MVTLILHITLFEQVGARKDKSLTLTSFGKFNLAKFVAGNNLIMSSMPGVLNLLPADQKAARDVVFCGRILCDSANA